MRTTLGRNAQNAQDQNFSSKGILTTCPTHHFFIVFLLTKNLENVKNHQMFLVFIIIFSKNAQNLKKVKCTSLAQCAEAILKCARNAKDEPILRVIAMSGHTASRQFVARKGRGKGDEKRTETIKKSLRKEFSARFL